MKSKSTNHTDLELDHTINVESILIEEYKFAGSFALQMLQERGNMLTVYSSFMSVLITAIVGLNLFDKFTISSYEYALPPLFFLLGALHALLFKRFAHLERKYHDYQQRMNKVRMIYSKKAKEANLGIGDAIAPITMPVTWKIIYPLWPTTLLFLVVSCFSFAAASYHYWNNLLVTAIVLLICLGAIVKLGRTTSTS